MKYKDIIELNLDVQNEYVEPVTYLFNKHGDYNCVLFEEVTYNPDEGESKPPLDKVTVKGYIDKDNYLFFSSRKKDVIISSGMNIYPSDIEKEILKNKFVKECIVIGINDKYFGEAIFAVCLINKLKNFKKI